MPENARPWIAALRHSHARLAATVARLTPGQLAGPSYDSDWTVAQVLSHLGSGAEIQGLALRAARDGQPAPSQGDFPAIWDRWNSLSPERMASGFLESDADFVAMLEELDEQALLTLRLSFAGMDLDMTTAVALRLNEHAVHAWDVQVALDPTAAVADDAVRLLVDRLAQMTRWVGKADRAGPEAPFSVAVTTMDPPRQWWLVVAADVTLGERAPAAPDSTLQASAEAFLRLVYGRLDPEHTPPDTQVQGRIGLDTLRAVFPGF